jgi:predicted nucleic acid-binding protein
MTNKMRPIRIYVDTSIFGGFYDSEFDKETKLLFDKILNGEFKLVISDLTQNELIKAPENVRNLLADLNIDSVEIIQISDEEINLAMNYVLENVVGKTSLDDCIHIAAATINNVDLLVSWNFKHIVNVMRIRGYNAVNIKNGYKTIDIRSPKDLIYYED